ncbi:helix-turn-helix domain-containing protein [Neomicrococcus lactis]|uniref:helix-turn-helix domain-containing protein n=1 Tax=Neomicrococcus lactis TaxID=732241 RepID=UPI002300D976|nr:helix-turn-helix domain-containing protein [Neomicrococcus lactis]
MTWQKKQAPSPVSNEPRFTLERTAEFLDCSVITVRRMISRGELRAYRYGKRLIRIDPADLQATRKVINPITFNVVNGGDDD